MLRRVLRPRVLVYGAVLLALCVGAAGAAWSLRTPLKVDVVRDRASLARIVAGGKLENVYRLQIMNATEQPQRYRIDGRRAATGLALASDARGRGRAGASRAGSRCGCSCPTARRRPAPTRSYFDAPRGTAARPSVSEKSVFLVPR